MAPATGRAGARAGSVTGARPTYRLHATGVSPLAGDSDDARLVLRAQAGDRDAAVLLYRRYFGEIYGFFWNQTANSQDSEDLTSETFLRVVRALPEFGARASFRTWLYEIAKNQLRDFWRYRARRPDCVPMEDSDFLLPTAGADSNTAASKATVERTRMILDALPPVYRTVLELRIIEGVSVKDTAERMAKTETHVKVLTHRALKRAARIAATLEGENTE
jgi:RNA polymerase sigma-70 factor (ECF subfamily)